MKRLILYEENTWNLCTESFHYLNQNNQTVLVSLKSQLSWYCRDRTRKPDQEYICKYNSDLAGKMVQMILVSSSINDIRMTNFT